MTPGPHADVRFSYNLSSLPASLGVGSKVSLKDDLMKDIQEGHLERARILCKEWQLCWSEHNIQRMAISVDKSTSRYIAN